MSEPLGLIDKAQRGRAIFELIRETIEPSIDKEGLDIPFAKKMALLRVAMIHLDAGKGSHTEVIGELLRLIA